MKNALVLAHATQKHYERLNAPGTQNVRNPRPMWQLVMEILPLYDHKKGTNFMTVNEIVGALKAKNFFANRSNVTQAIRFLQTEPGMIGEVEFPPFRQGRPMKGYFVWCSVLDILETINP